MIWIEEETLEGFNMIQLYLWHFNCSGHIFLTPLHVLVYILLSLYHLYSIPFSCMFSVYPRKCTSDVWSIYTLYLLSYSSYLSTYAAILKYLLVTTFKDIWAWELYISPACIVRALLIWKQTNYYILSKWAPIGC